MADRSPGPSLRAVGRAALVLTSGSAVAQLIGVGREIFIAAQVGISRDLDALLIALVLPLALSGVLTSGTITALVPAYLDARTAVGLVGARRLAGAVLMLVAIGAIFLSIGLTLVAGVAVGITGPGLSPESRADATAYLQLLAPVAFFAAVAGILRSICQAEERFTAIAIATLVGPALTLAILVGLWAPLGLGAYALGSLVGPMATVITLLVATARASIVPLPGVRFRGLGLGGFARHAWPLTVSAAILQVNVVADRAIASLIAPGAVSALRYGEVLIRTPISAIAPAWSAAIYPTQVRAAASPDSAALGVATSRSVAYALAAFIPLAALGAALAPLGVEVAYGRGAFGSGDVAVTAHVVAAFAPLMVVLMISPVLAGAHNARRRGLLLLTRGAMNVVMNVSLSIILGAWLGVAGVALATSVTSSILVVFLASRLARDEHEFSLRPLALTGLRAVAAIAGPALFVALVAWSGVGRGAGLSTLLLLAVLGLGALVAYAAVAWRIGLQEVPFVARLVAKRLGLIGRPSGPAD